jgi:hypothetical protein
VEGGGLDQFRSDNLAALRTCGIGSISFLEEEFNSAVDERFVTQLSDGTEAELCFNGRQKRVTLDNL